MALMEWRGECGLMVCEKGMVCISSAMLSWCEVREVVWRYVARGERLRYGYIKSFNGRMRDELLNESLFLDLDQARQIIAAWVAERAI